MTRIEAYSNYELNCDNFWDFEKFIDKIYDDFEKELLEARKKAYIDGGNDTYKSLLSTGMIKGK